MGRSPVCGRRGVRGLPPVACKHRLRPDRRGRRHLEQSREPVQVSGDGCGGVSRRQEGPKLGGMLAQGLDFIVVKLADDDRVYRSRSEEHTSELQSLMRISYAVFCLKKKIG